MKYLSYRREEFAFDRNIYLIEEETLNLIGLRITALLQTSSSFSVVNWYKHLSKKVCTSEESEYISHV